MAMCFLYAVAVLILLVVQLPLFALVILPLLVFYTFIQVGQQQVVLNLIPLPV